MTPVPDADAFRRLFDACRVVIFDFDGVIADSEKFHFIAYRDVFRRFGHEIDERLYYKYWTSLGQGARGEIERYGLDLDPDDIQSLKSPTFSEYCRDGSIKVFPEAARIIERLSRSTRMLTIASGSTRPDIEAILTNAGLMGYFSEIIGKDTVPTIKPAPDIFLAMLAATGASPDECLVIEDAEKGMQAAITAGIPVVVVRTEETKTFDFSAAQLVVENHAILERLVAAVTT